MPLIGLFRPFATSKTLAYVAFLAGLAGVYSLIPILLEFSRFHSLVNIPSDFHAVLSLVLGWLLVFRTNTAYSRWWEARTLWGGLVNASRNLAIKLTTSGALEENERQRAAKLIVEFPNALRRHLRSERSASDTESAAEFIPQFVANQLYQLAWDAKRAGRIDGDELRILDAELHRLMDICGGCERILKTRIVKSYRVFARQCVVLFLVTLPWGVVQDFGAWTLPITMITAYFMLGLETVAEHVEEPFGYDEDDLDLDALCTAIENSVSETFRLGRAATSTS